MKILDFGLARVVGQETGITQQGMIVGTPAYMAPEQSRAEPVDGRADLFSLGCVLYRMLTGALPFRGTDTLSILAALALDTPDPPDRLNPAVPPALAALVLRLLAKDPAGRPATAVEVAQALAALERDPATLLDQAAARPAPAAARPRAARRRRAACVATLLAVLGPLGYLLAPTVYRIATDQGELVVEIDDPRVAAILARSGVTIHDQATGRRYVVRPGGQAVRAGAYEVQVTEPDAGIAVSAREFTVRRNEKQVLRVTCDPGPAARARPEPAHPGPVLPDPGPTEEGRRLDGHGGPVITLAVSPDGAVLASGSKDQTIRLWDARTGAPRRTLAGHTSDLTWLAFSPDGQVVAGGSNESWEVAFWDVRTGARVRTLPRQTGKARSVAFAPDGGLAAVAYGSWDNSVKLWDPRTGTLLRTLADHDRGIWSVAISADGRALASGCNDQTVKLWDLPAGTLRRTLRGHKHLVACVAFSPDGKSLASAGADRAVKVWDVATGEERRTFHGEDEQWAVAFSPDGERVLAAGKDQTVRLWDVRGGRELGRWQGHVGPVWSVAFSRDGRHAWSAGEDGTVRRWPLPAPPAQAQAGPGRP